MIIGGLLVDRGGGVCVCGAGCDWSSLVIDACFEVRWIGVNETSLP